MSSPLKRIPIFLSSMPFRLLFLGVVLSSVFFAILCSCFPLLLLFYSSVTSQAVILSFVSQSLAYSSLSPLSLVIFSSFFGLNRLPSYTLDYNYILWISPRRLTSRLILPLAIIFPHAPGRVALFLDNTISMYLSRNRLSF